MTALLVALALAAAPADEPIPEEHRMPVMGCVKEEQACAVHISVLVQYMRERARLARELDSLRKVRVQQCASLEVTEPSKAPKLPLITPRPKEKD